MIEIIWIVSLIILIMLIWFNSEALIEWGSLFGLYKFLCVDEFYTKRIEYLPANLNYPSFLKIKFNNFITKLLACPLCICVWLSFLISFFMSLLSCDITDVLFMPIICVSALLFYGIIIKLLDFSK